MRGGWFAVLALVGCDEVVEVVETPPVLRPIVLDRVGRPAINAALVSPLAPRAVKDAARAAYNAAKPSEWAALRSSIATSLAVYDALDGVCGNQLLAGPAGPSRYDTLAGLLADDRLYVDTTKTSCGYLGAELGVGCGGRLLTDDVIDMTYSALAIGAPSGVSDGAMLDPKAVGPDFPYLRSP